MSTTVATPLAHPVERPPRKTGRGRRALIMAAVVLVVLSLVRAITGAAELTSPGTFGAALGLAMPILLAGMGGLYAERSGVVNIGLEGMMILGTWFGAWAGWKFGPWAGVILGSMGGALGGLLHALATVTFGIDQIVSGVAINILAAGTTRFLSVVAYPLGSGGSATQSPQVTGHLPTVTIPILSGGSVFGWHSPDVLGSLQRHHLFLLSDAAGVLKGVTANVAVLTVIALALIPVTWWFMWRTSLGLRIRSAGEHPIAAESLGVPVYTVKYIAVTLSGALAGLGGAFLVLAPGIGAGIYREGQTGGRGFIGLAALIFGNWRPGGVGGAAALFGYADALQLRSDTAVHGLLLFVAFALVAGLAYSARRRSQTYVPTGIIAVAAWLVLQWRPVLDRLNVVPSRGVARVTLALVALSVGFLVTALVAMLRERRFHGTPILALLAGGAAWWFLKSGQIANQFISMTPYLTTLVVLAVASQRLRPPAAEGRPYRRGQSQ